MRDTHSLSCSCAEAIRLLHARVTLARAWNVSFSYIQEVDKPAANVNANALVSSEAPRIDRKAGIGISKGPVLRRFQGKNGGELGTRFRLVREDKRASS